MSNAHYWSCVLLCTLASVLACEAWAAFVHRVIWHGPLWWVHKSHHAGPGDIAQQATPAKAFELNDIFGLLHAALAAALIIAASRREPDIYGVLSMGLGAGLTFYGVSYALIHDGLIHARLVRLDFTRGYLRQVRGAHLAHHRTGKAPYGLFWAPLLRRYRRRG